MATKHNFNPASEPLCYEPRMTRAEAIARRTAGTLRENCVVVITDGPTIGVPGFTSPTEIELNPTSPTELGQTARVHTTFDDTAWSGFYDIDLGVAGSITRLEDTSGNVAVDMDADSPTVHTQFPWHAGVRFGGLWRDNYAEDTTFTGITDGAVRFVQGNRFVNTSVDFTGWVGGNMTDNLIRAGGTHKTFGTSVWSRSVIDNATVNAVTDNITLAGSEIVDATTSISTTGNGTISVNNSRVEDASIILNAGEGNISLNNSNMRGGSQIQNDAGSMKTISLSNTVMDQFYTIRGQGGTVIRSISYAACNLRGRPGAVGTISVLYHGDASGIITNLEHVVSSPNAGWDIDGPTTASSLQFTNVKWVNGDFTHGPLATNCQWNDAELNNVFVDVQGPGINNFCLTITASRLIGTTIRHSAGVTETLQINNTLTNGISGVIAIDNASPRGLLIDGGSYLSGSFSVIQTGTVAQANIGNRADRVFNCQIDGGVVSFAATIAGTFPHVISDTKIIGGPNAPGIPDGIITIDGNSANVNVFSCEVWGELTITDAPQGALTSATAVYDNYIGSSCNLRYIGGDGVAKQVRNNRIEGNASSILCTGLTGTAGAGLGDVFSGRVANQSTLTVTGARVPGFPVRNFTIENGSTMTIPGNGSVLQVSLKNNADLDTGPFVHFDSEISGAFAKVATAANLNALCNKSYDDWV